MPLLVNLRHLAEDTVTLEGELPVAELDLQIQDDLIRTGPPLQYDLEVQLMGDSLLLQGSLELELDCECARCLKRFLYLLEIPQWACHVPLEGDEKAPISNDCVDLTPYVREDILLEFPRHPLCDPECAGLQKPKTGKTKNAPGGTKDVPSAWAKLDKLKF